MATPKICGIETEYAIIQLGIEEQNPIHASSILVSAYAQNQNSTEESGVAASVNWDFQDEMPGNDARGMAPVGSLPPLVETHLVNAVLTNGARFYVDHAHPELSTPECSNALQVTQYDRSGELILQEAMKAANETLEDHQEIIVYKDNSDGKGNSYGCHENYLMDRSTPFGEIVCHATAHFVTRQIFTGSGKIGCEIPGVDPESIKYQITQRADFFEEEVGLETTLKRPIINTRDEPHADSTKYRRLHVICGDANMSETATFLKVGSTALLLSMIEDRYLKNLFIFDNPIAAMRQVSHDLTLKSGLRLKDGTSISAIDLQWEMLRAAKEYVKQGGGESSGGDIADLVVEKWEHVLTNLESKPEKLVKEIDWIAKRVLLDGYVARHSITYFHPKAKSLAVQYHDIRRNSITAKLGLQRLIDDTDVNFGIRNPPETTRAYFRGKCLQKWPDAIVSANWDSIVFKLENGLLRRIPILEPGLSTEKQFRDLIESCATPLELVTAIEALNE